MRLLTTTAVIAALAACTPTEDPSDYSSVLPDERVQVNLPTDFSETRRDGEIARSYLLTAEVTDTVNGLVGGVLGTVGALTDLPPTWSNEEDNTAVWGPFADSLDAVESVLWVHYEAETDTYTWAIGQRARNTEDEWTEIVVGQVDPGATDEASSGWFYIDFDANAALDPTADTQGRFVSEYAIDALGVTATAGFEDFGDVDSDGVNGLYAYDQTHAGQGAMDLVWEEDTDDAGDLEETLVVRSRWMPDGAGRSDWYATGGDLGEFVGAASECWSNQFERTYTTANWVDEDEGDVSTCAFAEPEYNEDEDVIAR